MDFKRVLSSFYVYTDVQVTENLTAETAEAPEAESKSDTYKELEVKKQNSPLRNFLLRGHLGETYKPALILRFTDLP